ncbi:MAG: PQQ-like beta-propeller repeat protein [Myxococcales bacterium]|nr:PQQ-like beta-propeller repeat protein [Myxococcales bacterium]
MTSRPLLFSTLVAVALCFSACGGGDCPAGSVAFDGRCLPSGAEPCRVVGDCVERPGTVARCAASICAYECAEGLADCNGVPDDGCEVDLTSPDSCGACDVLCPGGDEAACGVSGCTLACREGRLDCDELAENGCETAIGTEDDCGACGDGCGLRATCRSLESPGELDCEPITLAYLYTAASSGGGSVTPVGLAATTEGAVLAFRYTGTIDPGRGVLTSPASSARSVVVALDHEGRPRWQRELPAPIRLEALTGSADGIVAVGSVLEQARQAYVVQMRLADGATVWEATFGDPFNADAQAFAATTRGDVVYVGGTVRDVADLGYGDGVNRAGCSEVACAVVAAYDLASGGLRWVQAGRSSGLSSGTGSRVTHLATSEERLVVAGLGMGSLRFDGDPVGVSLAATGDDGFVALFERSDGGFRRGRRLTGTAGQVRSLSTTGPTVEVGAQFYQPTILDGRAIDGTVEGVAAWLRLTDQLGVESLTVMEATSGARVDLAARGDTLGLALSHRGRASFFDETIEPSAPLGAVFAEQRDGRITWRQEGTGLDLRFLALDESAHLTLGEFRQASVGGLSRAGEGVAVVAWRR